MDYETAARIWLTIRTSRLDDLREMLADAAIRYAQLRVEWLRASPEHQATVGAERSACHNSFIGACDAMARNMDRIGEDGGWRHRLGNDRKVIGDFGCFLHCILAISAR